MRYDYCEFSSAAEADCAIEELLACGEITEDMEPDIRKVTACCYTITLNEPLAEC